MGREKPARQRVDRPCSRGVVHRAWVERDWRALEATKGQYRKIDLVVWEWNRKGSRISQSSLVVYRLTDSR